MAQRSNLVISPTGLALDDLQPSVLLAHELIRKSIPRERIAFALCRVGVSPAEIAEAGYRVLSGSIPEKIGYRRASDAGRALTETRFPSLNGRTDEMVQSLVNLLKKKSTGEAA